MYREKDADRKRTARLTLKLLKPKVHEEKARHEALRLKLYRLRKKMAMVKEKRTLEVAKETGSTNLENCFTRTCGPRRPAGCQVSEMKLY